jgi:ABC-2 type transport system permease protein
VALVVPLLFQFLVWASVGSPETGQYQSLGRLMGYYAFTLGIARLNNGWGVVNQISDDIEDGRLELWLVKPIGFMTQRMGMFLGEGLPYLAMLLCAWSIWALTASGFSHWFIRLPAVVALLLASEGLTFVLAFMLATVAFWRRKSGYLVSALASCTDSTRCTWRWAASVKRSWPMISSVSVDSC